MKEERRESILQDADRVLDDQKLKDNVTGKHKKISQCSIQLWFLRLSSCSECMFE